MLPGPIEGRAVFDSLEQLPADAILGIMAMFRADQSEHKIDLSVGVYQDEDGNTPIFEAVKRAEKAVFEEETTKTYVAIAGNAGFIKGAETLLWGAASPVVANARAATVQSPGGSGGLCVAAHLIRRAEADATVHLPDPSWPNHLPLLKLAGLRLEQYPYYERQQHRIDFEAMTRYVEQLGNRDLLLLHGCCHNPCGADLSREQWQILAKLCARRGVVPFIDFAYQGLAEGLEEDAYGARLMAEHVPELVVVTSCSKNLGLYRERVGAVSIVCADKEQRDTVFSNVSNVARGLYSMPPDHGAAIVAHILHDSELKTLWERELTGMRERINGLRQLLVDKLEEKDAPRDFSFIANERGMFSFLGITREQIVRLREEFHIYLVESSRINVAGITTKNVDHVAESITAVLKS
jgi:aspartate aminotransferase